MKGKIQPYLFWVLLIFLILGLYYPVIGVVALICMLAPVVTAPSRGRQWCGNYCPRGSFYDHLLARISPQKPIPGVFRHTWFRAVMMTLIMGIFSAQMYYAWGDLAAMGAVFVRVILITTLIGILLGVIYHQRTWCSFCPMGTLASWQSAHKKPNPLMVDDSCVNCKLCMKVCPLQLKPYTAKGSSAGFTDSDCLKCGRCIEKCPKKSLSWQRNGD